MQENTCNTIYLMLKAMAARASQASAIITPGHNPLTYELLLQQVEKVAQSLNEIGVARNDRVALLLPNGPEMATAFLGVAACCTCAPLNPGFRSSEFDSFFSELHPKALIVQSGIDSAARAVAQRHLIPVIELSSAGERQSGIFSLNIKPQTCASQVRFAEAHDVALILHTSGTTSRAKMVPLAHANLLASARNIAITLELTPEDRCLNIMPLSHVHGLVGALLSSMIAGSSIVCTPGLDPEKFFTYLESYRPTWYTAVPAMHQAILARAETNRDIISRCRLRFIRSSSAPLPPETMQKLEKVFAVPLIEAYGMTEASHQIASNPLPPGIRKPRSVGLSTGTEIGVMDEKGDLLPHESIGEVAIRGAAITSGYINEPDAHGNRFKHGWFMTGDRGYLDADHYLFLTGRLDETINRGGEKISPREIDEVLREHPAVAEAMAFPVPHRTLGQDIAAAVVLRQKAFATVAEIQRFAVARLADFKMPRQIFIVDSIPRTFAGKIQRNQLAEKFGLVPKNGETAGSELDFAVPRTQTEKSLASIWSLVLGVEVGIDDNFFYLGGDSIHIAQIVSRVRVATGTELSLYSFFDTPTVRGMARTISAPVSRSEDIEGEPRPLEPTAKELPLSYVQQRLWFLEQLHPGKPTYNRAVTLHLRGELQVAVLERCLGEIVDRHEILRANFPANDGRPMQVIAPRHKINLTVIDLCHLPNGDRKAEALGEAVNESRQPFDLAAEILFRPILYRLGNEEHLLLIVTHHIVFDGWSENILLGEIETLYKSLLKGEPSSLPEITVQYSDYVLWQQKQSQRDSWLTDLNYWKRSLDKPSVPLNLPTDRARPAVQSHCGASHTFVLPGNLSDQVKELARREQVTLFMVLLAAFKTLLCRYTGQEDILVGVPTAGRDRIETEPLIGVFINTLVLRTDLSGDPSFHGLLRRIRNVALKAFSHQGLPFEKLIEALRVERDLSRHLLFDVMFQLRNLPKPAVAKSELEIDSIDVDIGVAKFDLTLDIVERSDALACRFEYNTDLFNSDTITRIGNNYQTLLESIVANPGQRLSALPLLTDQEKHQLLTEWNDTKRDFPKQECVHQSFEQQVEKSPDAIAIIFQDQQLSYRELNQRANQLAQYLRKLGVRPEIVVGLCVNRSSDMVVGLLGILKAGGAYVPLDPEYPKDRLAFMLQDTQAAVLLTEERLSERFTGASAFDGSITTIQNPTVVCLDRDWEEIGKERKDNLETGATASNLAYVIYTSGSTGRPKGVMVSHAAVCNHMSWMQAAFPLTATDTAVQKTSFSFDVSVAELFAPLLAGARLVVVQPGKHYDSAYLIQLISEEKVTVLHVVPSLLQVLLENKDIESCSSLKHVFSGGEALPLEVQERFSNCIPAHLHNLYGPTETCIETLFWTCGADRKQRSVPIGRPIANTQAYLLDRHQGLVSVGVTGELYVAGAGLARGYTNAPELTAEKFVPNPFASEPGGRLYRTGDLARYRSDGSIEFLGRIDHQVKIRGFRIELGEIESTLRQNPAVSNAVVIARENAPGDKSLVAYVVCRPGADISRTELRSFLKRKLPGPMIPSAFVVLDSLPLLTNGKLNRQALPASSQTRPETEPFFIAPRTPIEEMLAKIWCEVFKIQRIGIHDDFFDLGGHSLLGIRLISRVRTAFQVELTLRTLFEMTTIARLANVILAQKASALGSAGFARIWAEIEEGSDAEAEGNVTAQKERRP